MNFTLTSYNTHINCKGFLIKVNCFLIFKLDEDIVHIYRPRTLCIMCVLVCSIQHDDKQTNRLQFKLYKGMLVLCWELFSLFYLLFMNICAPKRLHNIQASTHTHAYSIPTSTYTFWKTYILFTFRNK